MGQSAPGILAMEYTVHGKDNNGKLVKGASTPAL